MEEKNKGKLELLNKMITKDEVKTREQAGRTLTYVDGAYVIGKMNTIFGNTGWEYEIKELKTVSQTTQPHASKSNVTLNNVAYICQIVITVPNLVSGGICRINDVGFGNGLDADLGKAHESASKEAVTDAIKRCAKSLGNALGLSLYDKDNFKGNNYFPETTTGETGTKEPAAGATPSTPKVSSGSFKGATIPQIYQLLKLGYKGDPAKLSSKEAYTLIGNLMKVGK